MLCMHGIVWKRPFVWTGFISILSVLLVLLLLLVRHSFVWRCLLPQHSVATIKVLTIARYSKRVNKNKNHNRKFACIHICTPNKEKNRIKWTRTRRTKIKRKKTESGTKLAQGKCIFGRGKMPMKVDFLFGSVVGFMPKNCVWSAHWHQTKAVEWKTLDLHASEKYASDSCCVFVYVLVVGKEEAQFIDAQCSLCVIFSVLPFWVLLRLRDSMARCHCYCCNICCCQRN